MKRIVRSLGAASFFLALAILSGHPSMVQATVITFQDLREVVSLDVDGKINPPRTDINGESIAFAFPFQSDLEGRYGVVLTESDNPKKVSDYLFLLITPHSLNFQFFSDPFIVEGPSIFQSLLDKGLTLPETIDPLNVTSSFRDINGNPFLFPTGFTIRVQSDADPTTDVTEPSPLLLLGLGLLAMFFCHCVKFKFLKKYEPRSKLLNHRFSKGPSASA